MTVKKTLGALSSVIKTEYGHWQRAGLLTDINGPTVSDYILTWPNYDSSFDSKTYAEEYQYRRNNRQFSLLTNDGGLIQIFFQMSQAGLTNKKTPIFIKTQYAFYPNPEISSRAEFRIETDLTSFRPGFHPCTHFQTTAFSKYRMPCDHFPRIEIFLDHIARYWYEDSWKRRFPVAWQRLDEWNRTEKRSWDTVFKFGTSYTPVTVGNIRNSAMRQTDYGSFIDEMTRLGPLFKVDLDAFERHAMHISAAKNPWE